MAAPCVAFIGGSPVGCLVVPLLRGAAEKHACSVFLRHGILLCFVEVGLEATTDPITPLPYLSSSVLGRFLTSIPCVDSDSSILT